MCILCVDFVHAVMHTAAAMQDRSAQRRITAEWIRDLVDNRTLKDAAKDISAVTGWSLDHSRLSRYSDPDGITPIGAEVVGHFADYAEATGRAALDLTPPEPPKSYEERHLELLQEANVIAARQVEATTQQVALLTAILDRMATPNGQPGVAPALVTGAEEWASRQLAASQLRQPDPAATPE